jgi:GH25 family lysozyme M1 (1,4-beta-N-acetylmuramidase)
MSGTNLKKEFSKRDVQRMRNIITGNAGGSTGVQVGYTKQSQDYQEGDIWEENGKQWTIKNGIKQTITKHDQLRQLVNMPLACPTCHNPFKNNDINKKMWSIHHMCFNCVIDMEAKIKLEGKWDEYEKQMLNANKNSMVNDFEASIEEFLKMQNESYFTEQGDVESWSGGKINEEEIKNVKEYIKKLRETQI